MTRILSLFGLMRVREHERSVRALESQLVLRENAFEAIEGERDRLSDEFKQAVADLEKQAGEIADLRAELTSVKAANEAFINGNARLEKEVRGLRPDALAMRRKRQRDRELKAAKAAGKVQP